MRRGSGRLALACLCLALLAVSAVTAANTVPGSNAGRPTAATSPNTLKPAACGSIVLATLVTGAGIFNGTGGADLVLGSSGADTINGGGGDDCIVGGGGDDTLSGGAGNDVCIGGPGLDQNGVVIVVPTDQCETFVQ